MVAAAFQNVQEPGEVAVDIGPRILQGIPHAGLGGEMNHHVRAVRLKQLIDGRGVGQVHPCQWKIPHMVFNPCHAVMLELRDVVVKSEEHTSELQSLMRTSYDVFCLKPKTLSNKPLSNQSITD